MEVGRTVAVIGEQGEDVPASEDPGAEQSAEKPAEAPRREPERERGRQASTSFEEQVTEISAPRADGGRVKASPLARRIARERGIDLSGLRGTGPEGRVVAEDVERAAQAAPTAVPAAAAAGPTEGVEVEELSSMRRTIARRLTEAWEAPVFQIAMTADMRRALALRRRLVEAAGEGVRPTIGDVLTKLCAVALLRHRPVNALYRGDAVELHPTANVGLAVAIPKGLVVPVIPGCERLSIAEIAAARSELVERARSGKLRQPDLEGGTFTISNLGMYGVERFVAVLNPPQVAILAVGASEERPVVEDGAVVARPVMELTLTCDHRAVDGATAAEFLADVKRFLEEPGLAL